MVAQGLERSEMSTEVPSTIRQHGEPPLKKFPSRMRPKCPASSPQQWNCTRLGCAEHFVAANCADSLDDMIVELKASYVDPLDALIAELGRIEGHQTVLQDAVANNKAVVVHPRPEVWHDPSVWVPDVHM